MGSPTSAKDLAPHRSVLGRLVTLELGIAVAFILGFAFFLFDRLDYVLERRDRQIVTRELDRIARWDDIDKVRRYFADIRKADRRIAPDIIYAFVDRLSDCPPSAPLNNCAEDMLWMSEEVQKEPIDFARLVGLKVESHESRPDLKRPSGPAILRPTNEFLTNRGYYQARRIGDDGLLMVGIDRTEILKEGRALLLRSTILFTVFVTIAILLAAWSVARMKQRITKINATLERVGNGSLQQRILLAGTDDEIDVLGRHTNAMLDRLDDLVGSLQKLTKQLEQRNQFIRKTFGRYLTDEVVATLLESPTGLQIGGEKRKITMMMTDLRGFTSLSERLGPDRVVTILNRYLSAMVKVIKRYQGTIDEFIGDAIFVLFGAPLWQDDDAQRAVACAVQMQLAMAWVNGQNRQEGLPEIEMGIGIHTGEVVLGNIGSVERMKYGVVGSHVNFTSRVQSYSIGGQILISEATRKEAGNILTIGKQMEVRAKGIEGLVTVCEVLGIRGPFGLFLPETAEVLVPLTEEIPLKYATMDGAHLSGEMFQGRLTKLSSKRACARLEQPVPKLSNLKMLFTGNEGQQIRGALYGKVVETAPGTNMEFSICFTSMSPEIETFLYGLLKNRHGETPPVSSSRSPGGPTPGAALQ